MTGTKWQLVGFVAEKRNRIRLAKPGVGDSFTQIFKGNNSFSGRASVNLAQGEYNLTNSQLSMPEYHLRTYAFEKYDVPLYIEFMENVYAYRISRKGLELYYDLKQYLLFKPTE